MLHVCWAAALLAGACLTCCQDFFIHCVSTPSYSLLMVIMSSSRLPFCLRTVGESLQPTSNCICLLYNRVMSKARQANKVDCPRQHEHAHHTGVCMMMISTVCCTCDQHSPLVTSQIKSRVIQMQSNASRLKFKLATCFWVSRATCNEHNMATKLVG